MEKRREIRIGADIGGTFTDVALKVDETLYSCKVLTDYTAPERAILEGIERVVGEADINLGDIGMIIHGTTLATNALIQRSGTRTAFITTKGFRDVIEMRSESRFEQYDLDIRLPPPLISREDRFVVAGRISAKGEELIPLDENALIRIAGEIKSECFGAVAIGFLHSYMNGAHEQKAREILSRYLDIPISLSAEVSPQMREFERFNTVCANAYVRPQMARYLSRLKGRLQESGISCPVYMIHSGGGVMSLDTAIEFPVRLVESGPAGGAIFAADLARQFELDKVISFDMGGTTAKLCLIDDFQPQTARTFEVARTYRFSKGSGMPISIPVIEMIEIGAGGGSIAWVDAMRRIQVGPESSSSEPGPACYNRGGSHATVTDADLLLGKLDPDNFAGGKILLDDSAAQSAIDEDVGSKLGMDPLAAAFGICDVVDENMANAARVHAVENGKDISATTMIAFGGAAPLHAARLCEKLGVDRCLIPRGAGIGSAIGFLKAPFGYESLGSQVMSLANLDVEKLNHVLEELKISAESFVRRGATGSLEQEIIAFMRYAGQGWEIPVILPEQEFTAADESLIEDLFKERYRQFFGRSVEGPPIEFVTFAVKVQEVLPPPERFTLEETGNRIDQEDSVIPQRDVFDPVTGGMEASAIIPREHLTPGNRVSGPAIIVENETTTVVTSHFDLIVQAEGSLLLVSKGD